MWQPKILLQCITTTLLLLIYNTQQINAQCLTDDDSTLFLNPLARTNLYQGQQAFTLDLLKEINETSSDRNIFFSPYSTYHALLLAYFGAKGETERELRDVLRLNWAYNKFDVKQGYTLEKSKQKKSYDKPDAPVVFRSADKIFIAKEAELKECMKDQFYEELEMTDFVHEPELSRQKINGFVENITDGNIKDILQMGQISEMTRLVLANAAFFKGQWASKFNQSETTKDVFFSSPSKQVFVDMMHKTGAFNHAVNERLECHVLEMPYLGEDENGISMVIFLPPFTPNGLENVLNRLTPETLQEALDDGLQREVEVKFPKFMFEKSYELVPILNKMGIHDLFAPSSNLTGFSDTVNLQLDEAIHKAKIEINEDGSTAAAATVVFSFRSARPTEPAQFFCDHPFLFLIYDHRSKAILFTGIFRGSD